MLSARNSAIAARFGARASSYDRHAHVQQAVAASLAQLLPVRSAPRVLEVGCGTGLFTQELLRAYPGGRFVFTDLSPDMVDLCANQFRSAHARWAVMDAEQPDVSNRFDVIAASMTLHWLADPVAAVKRLTRRLTPGGVLLHATPAPDAFSEWHESLLKAGGENGLIRCPALPGIVREESLTMEGGALAFLRALRDIGATYPRMGHRPLPPGRLRRAIRILDTEYRGRVTWRIAYGVIAV